MANLVIKRDRSNEPFDELKIKNSIYEAGRDAGLEKSDLERVVEEVVDYVVSMARERNEVSTVEIREEVLSELEEVKPEIVEAWVEYDEQREKI